MTPEERADAVCKIMRGTMACYRDENWAQIADAIREAIAAAYEDAAKIAEGFKPDGYDIPATHWQKPIAAAIRKRAKE